MNNNNNGSCVITFVWSVIGIPVGTLRQHLFLSAHHQDVVACEHHKAPPIRGFFNTRFMFSYTRRADVGMVPFVSAVLCAAWENRSGIEQRSRRNFYAAMVARGQTATLPPPLQIPNGLLYFPSCPGLFFLSLLFIVTHLARVSPRSLSPRDTVRCSQKPYRGV